IDAECERRHATVNLAGDPSRPNELARGQPCALCANNSFLAQRRTILDIRFAPIPDIPDRQWQTRKLPFVYLPKKAMLVESSRSAIGRQSALSRHSSSNRAGFKVFCEMPLPGAWSSSRSAFA